MSYLSPKACRQAALQNLSGRVAFGGRYFRSPLLPPRNQFERALAMALVLGMRLEFER
jgi:hypothetical protein